MFNHKINQPFFLLNPYDPMIARSPVQWGKVFDNVLEDAVQHQIFQHLAPLLTRASHA